MLAAALFLAPTFSFAFFGCNRVDLKDIDPINNPSSANRAQLAQTLTEVQTAKIPLLFAGGDLVNNYAADTGQVLRSQLVGWGKEVIPQTSGMTVVPITGNHELNKKVGPQRLPSNFTYPVWKGWLMASPFEYRSNGPTPGSDPADQLTLDESKMSFTVDREGVRFIVLNTDTRTSVTDATTVTALGWIPAHWAAEQLAIAEKDRSIRAVFLIGHRNLLDPSNGVGDAPINAEAGKVLLNALKGKAKFRAYVCAHVHAWNVRPIPGTRAVQIIAGDGGSKLEEWAKPEFGWTEVRVHADGSAGYVRHHRPVPTPYNSPRLEGQTTTDIEVQIP